MCVSVCRRYCQQQIPSPVDGTDKGAQGTIYRVQQRGGERKDVIVKESVYDPAKRNFPRR